MYTDDLAASGTLLAEEAAPEESLRRLEAFLSALAALPKKSWRPRIDSRQIRIEGPGLDRTRRLLEILRIPSPGREIVHIAGTSGKGSTVMMMAEAMHAAGRRAAAFFSPHVLSLLERFWVRGRLIDPALGRRCAGKLAAAAAEMASDPEIGPPSYFEATMAILLLAAEETDCEVILLEAGLGGSYDATNAVGPARLDVITPIGFDHTDLLGDTIAQIARDKAGIITVGGAVISAAADPAARQEIEAAAAEKGAVLYAPPQVEWKEGGMFDLRFTDGALWTDFSPGMAGVHQAGNAALAAGACRLLGLDA
ncbi:MAG: Mur ligase family protein, partial [bacterium]|nr:Mur ligase family protein [bacterium]